MRSFILLFFIISFFKAGPLVATGPCSEVLVQILKNVHHFSHLEATHFERVIPVHRFSHSPLTSLRVFEQSIVCEYGCETSAQLYSLIKHKILKNSFNLSIQLDKAYLLFLEFLESEISRLQKERTLILSQKDLLENQKNLDEFSLFELDVLNQKISLFDQKLTMLVYYLNYEYPSKRGAHDFVADVLRFLSSGSK